MSTEIFTNSIFNSDEFHPWLGYSLAYYIGKELIKKNELSEFSELEKEDVVEAGNKLFGN